MFVHDLLLIDSSELLSAIGFDVINRYLEKSKFVL